MAETSRVRHTNTHTSQANTKDRLNYHLTAVNRHIDPSASAATRRV